MLYTNYNPMPHFRHEVIFEIDTHELKISNRHDQV